jgi:hypothetical protein
MRPRSSSHGADGEYAEDDIAAAQHGVAASDALFTHVSASGAKLSTASHAKVLSMAAAAGKAAGLTSVDTLALTAPAHTAFGFAAGWTAALGAHAKLGECAGPALSWRCAVHIQPCPPPPPPVRGMQCCRRARSLTPPRPCPP